SRRGAPTPPGADWPPPPAPGRDRAVSAAKVAPGKACPGADRGGSRGQRGGPTRGQQPRLRPLVRRLRTQQSLEEPVPTPGETLELAAACEALVPGIEDLAQGDGGEAGLGETMFDLEGLPELLAQALEAEASEDEVIIAALRLERGEPFGLLGLQAAVQGPVHQEHDLIGDGIDRRDDPQELAAGLE